ncbi:MAG: hypothetical protein WAV90_13025 [Gordonia amarae]
MSVLTDSRKLFLHTLFTTAIESGIGYWATVREYHWMRPEFHGQRGYPRGCEDLDGFFAVIDDNESGRRGMRADLATMERGVDLFIRYCRGEIDYHGKEVAPGARVELRPDHYWHRFLEAEATDGADGDYDANVADQILQFGLFGEAVYG